MGINYSLLNHNMIYKSSLENNDDIPFQCVFSYIDKYVEFIDDDKILIYKYKDLGIFKVYVGIVENILNKNYDSIDLDKFNRLSKTFNDFHSMKLDLLKLNNRDVRLFLNNYENTHITFNENYLETIV